VEEDAGEGEETLAIRLMRPVWGVAAPALEGESPREPKRAASFLRSGCSRRPMLTWCSNSAPAKPLSRRARALTRPAAVGGAEKVEAEA